MKNIIASIKKFVGILMLYVKNPFNKIKTEVDKVYHEFVNSVDGKKIFEQAKARLTADSKDAVIEEVLAFFKAKLVLAAKGNSKLVEVLMDYFKGKILSSLKK